MNIDSVLSSTYGLSPEKKTALGRVLDNQFDNPVDPYVFLERLIVQLFHKKNKSTYNLMLVKTAYENSSDVNNIEDLKTTINISGFDAVNTYCKNKKVDLIYTPMLLWNTKEVIWVK